MNFYWFFCLFFAMGAVFFDLMWEKVPNIWIVTGFCIRMSEHLLFEIRTDFPGAGIRFWGGIGMALVVFFPLFFGKMIGTGDIKVFLVLGSVLGSRKILICIGISFCIGALEALYLLFFRCDWRQRLAYFITYFQRVYTEKTILPYLVLGKRPENIHFTIPILGSVLLLYLGGN